MICSLRVRWKRSTTPLVCGSPSRAKPLGSEPAGALSAAEWAEGLGTKPWKRALDLK